MAAVIDVATFVKDAAAVAAAAAGDSCAYRCRPSAVDGSPLIHHILLHSSFVVWCLSVHSVELLSWD